MISLIKQHKQIVLLICVGIILAFTLQDLFSEQRQNSGLINSGKTLAPSNFGGRTTCEVPIPNINPNKADGQPIPQSDILQNADSISTSVTTSN